MPEEQRLVEIQILKLVAPKVLANQRNACTVACSLLAVARDARWRSDFGADVVAACSSVASAASALGFSPGSAAAACSSSASSAASAFASGTCFLVTP